MPEASLKIDLEPGGMGKRSFDNGVTWLSDGEQITGLPFGYYKIIFSNTLGYASPSPIQIDVTPRHKDYRSAVKYTPDYTILKKPEAELQREADQKLWDDKLDSLSEVLNADGRTAALRKGILDSLNDRFTRIEAIQKETFFFTR